MPGLIFDSFPAPRAHEAGRRLLGVPEEGEGDAGGVGRNARQSCGIVYWLEFFF